MLSKAKPSRAAITDASRDVLTIVIAMVLAAALSAFYLMHLGPDFADVSSLLMTGERVLNGEALYKDVRDVNPPFSVWLYLPYAFLQKLTGISAYVWLGIGLVAWVGASVFLLNQVLRDGAAVPLQRRRTMLWVIAGLCLIIMPSQFAQREHFCAIAALPFLALIGARLQTPYHPRLSTCLIIGAMAASLVILKPHYAVGFGLVLLWLAWQRKDLRLLFVPEALLMAGLTLAYAGSVYLVHPDFIDIMLPIVVDVYVLKRAPIDALFLLVALSVAVPLIVSLWIRTSEKETSHFVNVFCLAGLGFLVAYFFMGKGWTYHLLPTTLSIFVALVFQICLTESQNITAVRHRIQMAMSGLAFLIAALTSLQGFHPIKIPTQVYALKDKPSIVLVTPDIGTSVPIAGRLNAEWTERYAYDALGAIAAAYAGSATGEQRRLLETYVATELDNKAAHIAKVRPDLIVLDKASRQWHDLVVTDHRVAPILEEYQVIAERGELTYLALNDLISSSAPAN